MTAMMASASFDENSNYYQQQQLIHPLSDQISQLLIAHSEQLQQMSSESPMARSSDQQLWDRLFCELSVLRNLQNSTHARSVTSAAEDFPQVQHDRSAKSALPTSSLTSHVQALSRRVLANIRQDLDLSLCADVAENELDDADSSSTEWSPTAIAAFQNFAPSTEDDRCDLYSCDEFRMFEFKVKRCTRGRSHDWTECPFAHPGEKARRRDPRRYHYSGTACSEFRKGSCKKGDACEFAHGVFESWLHPARYRTQACKDGIKCRRRVCFFAHTAQQLRLLPAATTASGFPHAHLSGERKYRSGSFHCNSDDQCQVCAAAAAAGSQTPSPTSTLAYFPESPPCLSPLNSPSTSFASSDDQPPSVAYFSATSGLSSFPIYQKSKTFNSISSVAVPRIVDQTPLVSVKSAPASPAKTPDRFLASACSDFQPGAKSKAVADLTAAIQQRDHEWFEAINQSCWPFTTTCFSPSTSIALVGRTGKRLPCTSSAVAGNRSTSRMWVDCRVLSDVKADEQLDVAGAGAGAVNPLSSPAIYGRSAEESLVKQALVDDRSGELPKTVSCSRNMEDYTPSNVETNADESPDLEWVNELVA